MYKPLGRLPLPLRKNRKFIVTGGPFKACPDTMIGVKMAAEIQQVCHVDIPTQDFCTPDPQQMQAGLIKAVRHITAGEPVYVGCMAGKGRTGLFMAVLAKAFGVEHPVEYVRKHYYPHAVETAEQRQFVESFPIPKEVKRAILWAKIKSFFGGRELLTNAVD